MTRTIQLGDYATEISDQGAGEAVVLVHAIALDHHMWDGVAAQLATSYRVIALDLRGSRSGGERAAAADALERQAAGVNDVITALGLERVHVAGLSYGGAIRATGGARATGTHCITGDRRIDDEGLPGGVCKSRGRRRT